MQSELENLIARMYRAAIEHDEAVQAFHDLDAELEHEENELDQRHSELIKEAVKEARWTCQKFKELEATLMMASQGMPILQANLIAKEESKHIKFDLERRVLNFHRTRKVTHQDRMQRRHWQIEQMQNRKKKK